MQENYTTELRESFLEPNLYPKVYTIPNYINKRPGLLVSLVHYILYVKLQKSQHFSLRWSVHQAKRSKGLKRVWTRRVSLGREAKKFFLPSHAPLARNKSTVFRHFTPHNYPRIWRFASFSTRFAGKSNCLAVYLNPSYPYTLIHYFTALFQRHSPSFPRAESSSSVYTVLTLKGTNKTTKSHFWAWFQ